MIYLGTPGRMIGLKCPATQQVSHSERYTFRTTLEGRVKAQATPQQRRSWELGMSVLAPEQQGMIMEFAQGAWGNGPFWFFSADALVTNLLTPAVAALHPSVTGRSDGLSHNGPTRLEGGLVAPQSIRAHDTSRTIQFGPTDTPVIEGVPATASAYIQGADGYLLMQFFDADREFISGHRSPVSGSTQLVRRSVTQITPRNAVRVRLSVRSAIRAARPALTFTSNLLPWADGQGCEKAVVEAAPRNVLRALSDPNGGRYSEMSLRVLEVG